MAEILVIRLTPGAAEPASWCVVDSSGARLGPVESGPLQDSARLASQRKVYVLAPAAEVLLAHADLPVRSAAKLLQAVPFALEEQLAEDVDKLHFAVGKRGSTGTVPVAAAAKDRLENWLAELGAAGLEPDGLFSEGEGIPEIPNAVSLLFEGTTCLIRTPDGDTTVLEDLELREIAGLLDLVAAAPAEDAEEYEPVHVNVFLGQEEHRSLEADLEWLREHVTSLEVKLLPEGALPHLAVNLGAGYGINLLQGAYAPLTDSGPLWKPWRLAAALLIGLLGTVLVVQFIELRRLKAQEAKLDEAMTELVKKACPRTRRIVNARAQLESCGKISGGDPANMDQRFLRSLATLGSVMSETPNTQITGLSFRNAVMDLKLTVPNIDALDKIQRLVTERGDMEADIQAATPKDNRIEGRLKLSGAES